MIWFYIILGAVLLLFLLPACVLSWILYTILLVRNKPDDSR